MVSILDCDQPFYFPDAQPLTQRLVDVLETDVDESYYLSQDRINGAILSSQKQQEKGNGFKFNPTDGRGIASCIKCAAGSKKTDNYIKEEV